MRTLIPGSARTAVAPLLLIASLAIAAVPTGRHVSEGTTAANVDRVEIASHGRKRGEILAVSGGTWQERTNPASDNARDERVFEYKEQSRTGSSVILWDAYRGIELELDIAGGKVFYSDNNVRHRPVYDIGSATRAELADGRKIRYVSFAQDPGDSAEATLSNDDGDLWVLREGQERSFFFERSRSESGIQLRDYTNSAFVGLNFSDLAGAMASADGRRSQSFHIVDFSNDVPGIPPKPAIMHNRANGRTVMQLIVGVDTGDYGLLAKGPGQAWTLRSTFNNNLIGTYYESGRDDWSLYLAQDPAGTRPRLRVDLFEMQVYDANSGRYSYVIQSASNTPAAVEQQVAQTTHYPPDQSQARVPPVAPVPQGFHTQLGEVTYGEGGARVGEYTNLGDGRWRDTNIYGGTLVLAEERRSADAVYLKVPDRNETIQLNLTNGRIFRLTSASTAALYDILSTAQIAPAPGPAIPTAPSQSRVETGAVTPMESATLPPPATGAAAMSSVADPSPYTGDQQTLAEPTKLDTRTNPRLTRASTSPTDCGKEGQRPCSTAPAIFVQQGVAAGCPDGSDFFPFVRGGSCWSCPAGSRYFPPSDIEGARACTYPASQSRAPATFTGPVEFLQCPNGGAARGIGNKCWKCPDGFFPDILEQADGPRGCFRDNAASYAQATLTRTTACPDGSSAEVLDNLNCWKCPAGFSRSGSPPSWPDACSTNIWDATFATLGAGTCAAGLENFRGVCERRGSCGEIGGRPCEIGERLPSCDAGAREDFHSNTCVALQPGESPFIAGLGSVSEFYGDSIVLFCKQTIGSLRFDGGTDLGIGANCTKDIFTGASCQFVAASLGGKYAAMVNSAATAGPQFEAFKQKVDTAYEASPCSALTETLRPAINHGAASGLSCPGDQFWDPNGSCYSCPDGFSRTMNPVTSAAACVDKPGNELARSACAVYRAATEDLEDAALCSKEVLESGVLFDRPMDLNGAQGEVCMAAGEFAYSIYALIGSTESPEKKSSRMREALSQLLHKAGVIGAGVKVTDKAGNVGTAFDQLAHCH